MRGCVHIYCGDGKGKTTAATGLAVRGAGRDLRVLIARFLKTEDSGEVAVLRSIPQITVLPCEKTFGFYFQMSEEQKMEAAEYYRGLLELAWERAAKEDFHMLILDEIMAACSCHLVEEKRLLEHLDKKPDGMEVVLTGRDPSKALQERADYISEIRKIKHPYESGLSARVGIEY